MVPVNVFFERDLIGLLGNKLLKEFIPIVNEFKTDTTGELITTSTVANKIHKNDEGDVFIMGTFKIKTQTRFIIVLITLMLVVPHKSRSMEKYYDLTIQIPDWSAIKKYIPNHAALTGKLTEKMKELCNVSVNEYNIHIKYDELQDKLLNQFDKNIYKF